MIRNRWPIAVLLLLALMIGVSVQAVGGQASYVHTTPPGDSAYAEAAQEETPVVFGKDKGDNFINLAARVFGKDLRGYQYVCFDDLWTPSISDDLQALQDLLMDTQMALTVGERSPQGYLYKGTEAYTIVEQPDGSLTLTQYALTPVEEWKQLDNPADVPLYREVSSENQMVPASVAKSLYE